MNDTSMDARVRTKRSRAVPLLSRVGALALALGGVTLALAPSASASGDIISGNPTCEDVIPGSTEIKFDPPTPGSDTKDGVTVTWTERILAADDPDHPGDQTGGQVVDLESEDVGVERDCALRVICVDLEMNWSCHTGTR